MWMLLLIVSIAWLLWVIVCLIALEADKRQHKRPRHATFSIVPVIPLFPLLFLGAAGFINRIVPSWGTRLIGALHLLLIAIYLAGIIFELRRMRSAGPSSV
jgi:uncharacterized membrane protein YadS